MNYQVENIYTEETKGFITKNEAYNYMYAEIERLNNNWGEDCWGLDDFILYYFDGENWEWIEVE